MKSICVSLVLIFASLSLMASRLIPIDTSRLDPWLGEWEGQLEIYNKNGLSQTVLMEIKHFKTDTIGTYGWYLIYGDDKDAGTRPYYLKVVDEEIGHFIIDEKNSIILDEYMIANKMISNFDVMGSLITSVYTLLENGDMIFEIFYSNSTEPNISGNTLVNDEEIPKVFSYRVGGYQKALLKRKK